MYRVYYIANVMALEKISNCNDDIDLRIHQNDVINRSHQYIFSHKYNISGKEMVVTSIKLRVGCWKAVTALHTQSIHPPILVNSLLPPFVCFYFMLLCVWSRYNMMIIIHIN